MPDHQHMHGKRVDGPSRTPTARGPASGAAGVVAASVVPVAGLAAGPLRRQVVRREGEDDDGFQTVGAKKKKKPTGPPAVTVDQIIAGAQAQKVNVGWATADVAEQAGERWVGEGSKKVPYKDSYLLVSKDQLRQYRAPEWKPSWKQYQANFEMRAQPSGPWQKPGTHLEVRDS